MSKIIDSLKASAAALTQNRGATETTDNARSMQEMTQQQLADIYFSSADKGKRSEYPLVIKVVEKPKGSSITPWLITSIAFLITAMSLFTTKRVFVDVKIIDDQSLVASDWKAAPTAPSRAGEEASLGIPMQDFMFEGAAKINSAKSDLQLTLVNSSVASFARATFIAAAPMDLSSSKIVFYAKGIRGGENIGFGLKDGGNNLAFAKGSTFPFPGRLTREWRRAEITMSDTSQNFDPKNVTGMRFDFGSRDINNKSGDTVLIKGLEVVPL